MTEDLLAAKNVIVQGITGAHGAFHTRAMIQAGTNIVAGTSPKKAGQLINGVPVYATVAAIQAEMTVDASVIFVPASAAKAAIIEAVSAKISLIVCITEGIPVHDMLQISQHLLKGQSRLIGPNCPGILLPGSNKLGIIPAHLAMPGATAVVSRSGTLTYEVVDSLTSRGVGQKYIIGIGGDRIAGTSFIDCLQLFQADPDVANIILIGEIGGTSEIEAADYIAQNITKPVYAYITGHHAPAGVQLGHAGAILGSNLESAQAKTSYLKGVGCTTATNLSQLLRKLAS